jgi:5-methylcytosine-specific restriction endonuclease McrA
VGVVILRAYALPSALHFLLYKRKIICYVLYLMSSVLDRLILKLNANWQAFEVLSVRDAITMLCSESQGQKPGYAMDFVTIKSDDGQSTLQYANPVAWDEWITLPVRDGDPVINTVRGPIRCPLVVICANYNQIPLVAPKLGNEAILKRDGYTCQYSGKKLPRSKLNIDHVIPRDRGGRDTWENMVASDKDINFSKGNRMNHEVGLKLIRKPVAPKQTVKVVRPEDIPLETREQVLPFLLK